MNSFDIGNITRSLYCKKNQFYFTGMIVCFLISAMEMSMDPAKISAVTTPTNVFLGFISLFVSYLPLCGDSSTPLRERLCIPGKLTLAHLLDFSKPSETFILDMDAGECGQAGIERVVA